MVVAIDRFARTTNLETRDRTVLHVGCGPRMVGVLHPLFRAPGWTEVRLDIDPSVAPDIVASIVDMEGVQSSSVDAVWSSHNLEHLYPHEVLPALTEFFRVLNSDGFALITVPDLECVAELVAAGRLLDPAYNSPAGPITPLDMLFGHRASLARGNLFMAHHTGFSAKSLSLALLQAGFKGVKVERCDFALWAIAEKSAPHYTSRAPTRENAKPV
jgi:hypothetical protein